MVSRRGILAAILVLPSSAVAPPARAAAAVVLIDQVWVAGSRYYDIAKAWLELDAGGPLALRREPGNRYDGKAIAVHSPQGFKLGFIPRDRNEALAALMDAGRTLQATIVTTRDGYNSKTGVLEYREPVYRVELIG